ncbi:MAG TPA: hypothetical protein VMT24_05775 [Aggregatilineaceae bacterium]|nr:hypothetical protein [Aggregatilineaceae bacterium]
MYSSRPVNLVPASNRTAATARARLLRDTEMRRNKAPSTEATPLPAPPITETFPAQAVRSALSAAWSFHHLTPLDQKRQAIQIAQSYGSHYLAEISYHDDRQMTVAILKPAQIRRHALDVPHMIYVDSAGNVNVFSSAQSPVPARIFAIGWVLLAISVSLILAGALVLLT